jgi:hypothetical protein
MGETAHSARNQTVFFKNFHTFQSEGGWFSTFAPGSHIEKHFNNPLSNGIGLAVS